MNWFKIFYRHPDRVRIALGGIAGALLFVSGPHLVAAWMRYWN